jgi:NAD(P)-dependent dehydrogenase (short-subunit alcohol dehydrogenase family)
MTGSPRDLEGGVAVVTGAGSGIGRGMALAFAEAGMHVVIADIEKDSGEAVAGEIAARGLRALAVQTDVARRESLEALAERTLAELGRVNVLCNNAGVSTFAPLDGLRDSDWEWVLSVNLFGVIYGIQAFLPRMRAQKSWGHIVNTASIVGLRARAGVAPYAASKYAVVGISEAIRAERTLHGIGCSVLCPGMVATRLARSERNRPPEQGTPTGVDTTLLETALAAGADPEEVGRIVREAVIEDRFWVQTDPEARAESEERLAEILASFDQLGS